jgi:hypothetical protein
MREKGCGKGDAMNEDSEPLMSMSDQGLKPMGMKCQEIFSSPTSRPAKFLNREGDMSVIKVVRSCQRDLHRRCSYRGHPDGN